MDEIGASKSCRAVRLLDARAFELKAAAYDAFNQIWKSMVHADVELGKITIRDAAEGTFIPKHVLKGANSITDGKMTLTDAVVGLKAYKEVDERAEQLWHNLDASIVSPRANFNAKSRKHIVAGQDELALEGDADGSIHALLDDLETVVVFIAKKLPEDLLQAVSKLMMADLVPKLVTQWLDSGVPSGLQDMDRFQGVIQRAQQFCATLQESGFSGFDELKSWADKAPMIWLGKCRDTALNTVRGRLVHGIGKPKQVEKIEKHMVTVSEGRELATTGAGAAADTNDWNEDWDEPWNDEEQTTVEEPSNDQDAAADDGTDAWGWDDGLDEQAEADPSEEPAAAGAEDDEAEDDGADAWGWGDEDTATIAPEPEPETKQKKPKMPKKLAHQPAQQPDSRQEETRELVLKETYSISSMPEPVLDLIYSVLEDGAALTKEDGEYALVSGTAAGLFSLPTFALALFRAISPHYYSFDVGGGM